jgi:PHP family Zn ribbon phosphoesterase
MLSQIRDERMDRNTESLAVDHESPEKQPKNPLARLRSDLHIHSVLSPCSERDMTPGNIVGMAMISQIDVIAITDHQSCGNCAAAMAISQRIGGPIVIAGIEAESAEEIHLLCLFPDLSSAKACEMKLQENQPFIENRTDIFGEQWLMDENDERVAIEERMLLMPSRLTCNEIAQMVLSLGGACLPAHLDREANSMLISLGSVPPDFPAAVIELSRNVDPDRFFAEHLDLLQYQYIVNSDAHRLETIAQFPSLTDHAEANGKVKHTQFTAKEIIEALRPSVP